MKKNILLVSISPKLWKAVVMKQTIEYLNQSNKSGFLQTRLGFLMFMFQCLCIIVDFSLDVCLLYLS